MEETYGVWLTKVELEAVQYAMLSAENEGMTLSAHDSAYEAISVAYDNAPEE